MYINRKKKFNRKQTSGTITQSLKHEQYTQPKHVHRDNGNWNKYASYLRQKQIKHAVNK